MMITELIRDQVTAVTVMFGAGICVAMLYQVFGCTIKRRAGRAPLKILLEISFWAAAAFIASKFLYYCAYGKLSVHGAVAFALGALLWKLCFCDIIYKICAFFETRLKIEKDHGKEETKQSV